MCGTDWIEALNEKNYKKYGRCILAPSLDLVERVFADYDSEEEAKVVRSLVEEIRSKQYYIPALELIMVDDTDSVVGYAMFSRFQLEGKFDEELLILTPVAVKTELQRRHISKDLIEAGFEKAKEMGFKAVLVEGNPQNYNARGFVTSADYGIVAGPDIHLPDINCLMIKELEEHALEHIKGVVDYSFYSMLR
ncbi:GNAT family N-acetyltransferase [Bifidobacterium gallicum]|uniref:Acetyltransferase, GNAT family n=1 Tax=Bifidobacterium gallicum DSM 20093 = LMG 11596 TaxID=561180 RepID=D1NT40_9BIFI|nr:N-acetyltransferase [Bifidobacterium gallicum]EFA23842.1 acetyltransferase, GNAT family [Bifidobacterium gallicum DSM 20093 = LMG 11596]KFI59168.1 GNAT family acetyltransferase [Bifidobacterium gallicum DSM 20093 = LMG 11596]